MKLSRRCETASAVVVVLALLGILSLYVLANARTLYHLKHEVKRIEVRQLQRLQAVVRPAPTATATNAASAGNATTPVASR